MFPVKDAKFIIVNKIVQNCNLVDKKCVNIHVDKGMAPVL